MANIVARPRTTSTQRNRHKPKSNPRAACFSSRPMYPFVLFLLCRHISRLWHPFLPVLQSGRPSSLTPPISSFNQSHLPSLFVHPFLRQAVRPRQAEAEVERRRQGENEEEEEEEERDSGGEGGGGGRQLPQRPQPQQRRHCDTATLRRDE